MSEKFRAYQPPWQCIFVSADGFACLLCGQTERPVLVLDQPGTKPLAGICESCSIHAHFAWRKLPGDALPVDAAKVTVPTQVKLLLPRLREGSKGQEALVLSYEFLMVKEGAFQELPGADLLPGETLFAAAERVLADLNLKTWPLFVEPLYRGYTARGSLVAVMLVTVTARGDYRKDSVRSWKEWPIENHVAAGSRGFYLALEEVWSLRLHKFLAQASRSSRISIELRESAASYIDLQSKVRAKVKGLDLSMVEYWRKTMTDDEKLVDRKLCEWEESSAELAAQKALEAAEAGESSSVSQSFPSSSVEISRSDVLLDEEEAPSDDEGGGQEDDFGEETEPNAEKTAETEPPAGFARRGRPLITAGRG